MPASRVSATKESEPTAPRAGALPVLVALVVGAAALRPLVADWLDGEGLRAWATVFVAICVQALPFLVLGVAVSGAIAAYVPPAVLARLLPDRKWLAVPVAAAAGVALPGCECGSVPIAGRLVARGVTPAAAVTFLLAAPAVNPVVLVATAVAFPGRPEMVLARFLASLLAACVVGFVWIVEGRDEWTAKALRNEREAGSRFGTFVETAEHDFLHAGGFLVIGAATAAFLQTVVPRSVLDDVAGRGAFGVLAMAGLAVILAICSEADAFVAASLTQFSLTARLAFMVVGPMVDVKLDRAPGRHVRSPVHDVLRAAHLLRRRQRRRSSSGRCCCERRRRRDPHRGHRRGARPARPPGHLPQLRPPRDGAVDRHRRRAARPPRRHGAVAPPARRRTTTATTSTAANRSRGYSSPRCWPCC